MMDIPKHLLYTKEHEWVEFQNELAVIGITDYAQSQLGDVIFIEFPEIGDELISGSSFGEVEAVKTVSDLYAPISGKVIGINQKLEDSPESVNNDPYGNGWILKIKPSNLKEKVRLLDAENYQKLIN